MSREKPLRSRLPTEFDRGKAWAARSAARRFRKLFTVPNPRRPAHNAQLKMTEEILKHLQETIEREIPMCAEMHMKIQSFEGQGLTIQAPLVPNRNHQATAFAGSLNALCTMSGWAMAYLILDQHSLHGSIVIRRSAIKYLSPVESTDIVARCQLPCEKDQQHFLEMLREKGQSKIDLRSEIKQNGETAVSFHGSYVVLDGQSSAD